jgi:AraC-like DNA-binding protein
MPIYMDRHDVSENVTAEIVAHLHEQDLKVQQQFDCRGLTYWFDDKRKTAFCLVEAPDKLAIQQMHNQAHGEVPHAIIEVDASIVESFLGRIEDPERAQNTELNIINDPAFRTIMVTEVNRLFLNKQNAVQVNVFFESLFKSMVEIFNNFNGRIVKQNDDYFLASFESVSKAVLCAVEMQSKFQLLSRTFENGETSLIIALSAGVPVNGDKTFFEDTVKSAERMCSITDSGIVVSSEVKELFKSENLNDFIESGNVFALTSPDEKFINILMDYTEKTWSDNELKVDDFSKPMGYSKSQLYRKMMALTGKSPNTFLKEYRLSKALKLLNKKTANISEIAFDTGFNSPSYFSKCFNKRYGIQPSEYITARMA